MDKGLWETQLLLIQVVGGKVCVEGPDMQQTTFHISSFFFHLQFQDLLVGIWESHLEHSFLYYLMFPSTHTHTLSFLLLPPRQVSPYSMSDAAAFFQCLPASSAEYSGLQPGSMLLTHDPVCLLFSCSAAVSISNSVCLCMVAPVTERHLLTYC